MARKSIKGYAEKNYYDNTRFNGGIIATNDPLNEGYFKHLVNFDISDMGQSITPRKGFLTTSMKHKQGLSSEVYCRDIYTYDYNSPNKYKISYYTSNSNITLVFGGTWQLGLDGGNNMHIIIDSEGRIAYAAINQKGTSMQFGNYYSDPYYRQDNTPFITQYQTTNYYNLSLYVGYTLIVITDKTVANNLISFISGGHYPNVQPIPEYLQSSTSVISDSMRLKIINNNLYIYNYNTTDLSLELQNSNTLINVSLPNNTIYFYDTSLGRYIFIDFNQYKAWNVKFDLRDNFITDCNVIQHIDISDLSTILPNIADVKYLVPIMNNQAMHIIDDNFVTGYIIKVKCNRGLETDKTFWLKLFYRENETSSLDNKLYEKDTLVITYLDMDDIVDTVDTNNRNLASTRSVIPNPMQVIYNNTDDIAHIDSVPMIYFKQNNKYLINKAKISLDNVEIIPNFYIADTHENYEWAYTYDIVSTNKDLSISESMDSNVLYKSPIFYIRNNSKVDIPTTFVELLSRYREESLNYLQNINPKLELEPYLSIQNRLSTSQYIRYLDCTDAKSFMEAYSYILYIVPTPGVNRFPMDLTRTDLLGPLGLYTYFGNSCAYLEGTSSSPVDATGATEHNKFLKENLNLFNYRYCHYEPLIDTNGDMIYKIKDAKNAEELLNILNSTGDGFYSDFSVYIETLPKVDYFSNEPGGFQNCYQTCVNSSIYSWVHEPKSPREILADKELLTKLNNAVSLLIKPLEYLTVVNVTGNSELLGNSYKRLFTNIPEKTGTITYYIAIDQNVTPYPLYSYRDTTGNYFGYDTTDDLSKNILDSIPVTDIDRIFFWGNTDTPSTDPIVYNHYSYKTEAFPINNEHRNTSMFNRSSTTLKATLNSTNTIYKFLQNLKFFDQGLIINFYLVLIPDSNYISNFEDLSREYLINSTSLKISKDIYTESRTSVSVSTYVEYLTEEPMLIANAENSLVFESTLGYHLVIYTGNKVFISKENKPNYFIYDYLKEYSEPVVKVIAYKDMLLVFTTLNLYAIYLYELVETVQNGTDSEGNIQTTQVSTLKFASLPVLYNLMVNEKYKDAIQVYNQMVLFYSADGQMFLIKPTAAIDSNTRFSIQYFNKSANDILLNYKDYMQQRLKAYNLSDKIIEDVDIKVTADINYIKIFYNGYEMIKNELTNVYEKNYIITYILIYDVLNNRYYTYDTVSFSNIYNIYNTDIGEVYVTEYKNELYFTLPYNNINEFDNNIDLSVYNNFSVQPIKSELDTGTLNLNNHLKKRFKDLHVIYKNLNANSLEFKLETFIDDIPIVSYISNTLDIKNISNYNTLVIVEDTKVKQLIDNIALFNFADYNSNKIITHKSNIVSKGKTIRIKMNFSSEGKYKIQGYGLVYKEHTI